MAGVMLLESTRYRFARSAAATALWCLPAFAVAMPSGLLWFGLLLLGTTLLVPDQLWAARREMGATLTVVFWLAIAVLAIAVVSVGLNDLGWREIDTRTRMLVIPWAALWAYALQPSRRMLWLGALCGIAFAFALALWQVLGGAARADGWTNAIVFADVVLGLMVLAVFCRAPGRWGWSLAAIVLGVVTIVLSGSRGAWPGLLTILLVMALGSSWKTGRLRFLLLGITFVLGAGLMLKVPALSEQVRLTELRQDVGRYEQGDHDSSTGARLERLSVAGRTFVMHPLTGIGIGRFDEAMKQLPVCRQGWQERCHLGHAHNDLAEWAATLGVPGLVAIIALYALPLWLFVRLIRAAGHGRRPRGSAWAGAMLVVMYVLCGLTQSMFAHQLTAGFYAATVGVLLGLAMREAKAARGGADID